MPDRRDKIVAQNALLTAALQLRRLDRIGKTPVDKGRPEDAEFYKNHPLRDMVSYGDSHRLMVAEWLESLANDIEGEN